MPFVFMAPVCRGLVELPVAGHTGATVHILRDYVEYVFHTRQVSWLLASMAIYVVPALWTVVTARRLVPILKGTDLRSVALSDQSGVMV